MICLAAWHYVYSDPFGSYTFTHYRRLEAGMLDSQSEKILGRFVQELRSLLADELVAIALYGSSVGGNFVPGVSDLNVVIVVKEARFDVLQKLQPGMAAWHTQGFAIPLLLDQEFLRRSRDVFPMEFHDMKEQHRLLWGEDIFRDSIRRNYLK